MTLRKALFSFVALIAFTQVHSGWTQETATEVPAADKEAVKAAYDKAEKEYKDVLKKIVALRGTFEEASDEEREKINKDLAPVIKEAQSKVEAWTSAALELYKVAPNENQEVSDLLAGMAQFLAQGSAPPGAKGGSFMGGDQYETALPIIKALVENKHPDKNLHVWGAVAAVCTGDFETAKEYFEAAQESGALADRNEFNMNAVRYLAELDKFRADWEAEKKIREAEAKADDLPRVKFTTSKGDIVIELFENEAPIATANMISLVKEGFYTNVVFHRVLPNFMAQGGDPTGTGSGGPGHNIKCECYEDNARKHFRGTISMAHAGRNTGGSQFFLCFVPTDFLNGRHTAFGRVIEGMDVLGKIQRIDPSKTGPFPEPDKIIKAEVLRDRGHGYEFEKLPER